MLEYVKETVSRYCPWPLPTTAALTTAHFVEAAGFTHESHTLETSDGYMLGLSRILSPRPDQRPICLIVHGIMSCSDFFVCQRPNPALDEHGALRNKSLPLYLSHHHGYDVWLLNNRGARYSTRHATRSQDSESYWDFTWLDMARIDLPECVSYIMKSTGQSSLSICAFSQGTAQVMSALAMNDALLASRIRTIILFSPVLVPRIKQAPIIQFFLSRPWLVTAVLGKKSLVWPVELTRSVLPDWAFAWICYTISGYLFGWRMDHMTGRERDLMYQNIASTTSVKVLLHWLAIAKSRAFQDELQRELVCDALESTSVYAVIGEDDSLPDHDLFHAWIGAGKAKVLTVPGYEHIETIWAGDWSIKVRPFVEEAVQSDLQDWHERTL